MKVRESSDSEVGADQREPVADASTEEQPSAQLWTLKVFRGAAVQVLKFDQVKESDSWKESG